MHQATFFRFPATHHIARLPAVVSPHSPLPALAPFARLLLSRQVSAEEKLDGANLGLSLSSSGRIQVQCRDQYLARPFSGQFAELSGWLARHEAKLRQVLSPNLILFGEWCSVRYALEYTALPDLFLLFDVYDRDAGRFWSTRRRDAFAKTAGLSLVGRVLQGHTNLRELTRIVCTASSNYRTGALEGLVIRHDSADWCLERGKLVRPGFVQVKTAQLLSRNLQWNLVRPPVSHKPRSADLGMDELRVPAFAPQAGHEHYAFA